MSVVSKSRIEWNRLALDPRDDKFWSQKIAAPTDECPTGSAVEDAVWYFPKDLMGSLAITARTINWNVKIGKTQRLTDEEYEPLLTLCKSLAVALFCKSGRFRHSAISTVKSRLEKFLDLVAYMAAWPWQEGKTTLLQLTAADAEAFVAWTSQSWRPGASTFDGLSATLREVQRLGKNGILRDRFNDDTLKAALSACDTIHHAEDDGEKDVNAPSEFSAPPYSNEYCLALLDISDFYMSELSDDICIHLRELISLQQEQDEVLAKVGRMYCRDKRWARNRYKLFLKNHPFKAGALPFVHRYHFPPKNSFDLITLVVMLQTANLQRIAMSTAGREGELLWMDRGCLSRAVADDREFDLISSRRFKNSSRLGGFSIDWHVSSSAAEAVRIQEKLADAADSEHLWLQMAYNRVGGRGRLTGSTSTKLQRFAELHDLDIGPCGTAYLQRFRPTMALLLMKGPKRHPHLVQRALGHDNLETSIKYLKMNRYLQADLAVALHGERKASPDVQEGPTVRSSEEEIDAAALDAILCEQQRSGMTARILAPDVIAFIEGGQSLDEIDTEAGGSAALGYALGKLIQRDVRHFPDLVGWYSSEAVRLSEAWPTAEFSLPGRLKSFLSVLRDDVGSPSSG
ncbi:hypothetical protein [Afipia sp. GAS231]|uniref:hypothetical protein n=1 Tax=Afipia sp. GAS231 TaxID=1882747 RepID=UPI00087AFC52|nr:hypothetical protein [Afipia sp. GAS231]SDO48284.1 hypothetical protein SAMN05444050_4246 [Afipia sp. GAS231]